MSEEIKKLALQRIENGGAGAEKFEESLKQTIKRSELGRIDSLRYTVLSLVAETQYEEATEQLKHYIAGLHRYPLFHKRVKRFEDHCQALIQAIKAKRTFKGKAALTMSKQQELMEKILEHFSELKAILTSIEKVEVEEKLVDYKSTVWSVHAFFYSVVFLIVLTAVQDGVLREWNSFQVVSTDIFDRLSTILMGYF